MYFYRQEGDKIHIHALTKKMWECALLCQFFDKAAKGFKVRGVTGSLLFAIRSQVLLL